MRYFRPRSSKPAAKEPRWLRAVESIGAFGAFGFALLLNLRPKSLLLAAAVGLIIGPSNLQPTQAAIVLLVVVAIGGCTVTAPIVWYLVRPAQARRLLSAASGWVRRHSRLIIFVVVVVVGAVIFVHGLGRF